MSLIKLQSVSKSYAERPILRSVSLRLQPGERLGLLGKNGSGKTTILRLILGQEEPGDGTVYVAPGARIGYFSQFSELTGALSVQQVLEDLFADIRAVEQELEVIAGHLETVTDADAMEHLLERQAVLLDEMNRREGWDYGRKIDTALSKLGFNETHRALPIDQLSGGWRNRASLARILLEEPDILLLDEPTNFLDIAGVSWLEQWLTSFRGGILVVSHDRNFLDAIVTRVVEIENHQAHDYEGGYTDYIRQKTFRIKTIERQFEHEEELLVFETEAVADREEAKKDPSGSVLRKLAEIRKRKEPRPVDSIVTSLYQGLRVSELICEIEDLSKSYGDRCLFSGLFLNITMGERVAVVGANGSGKSTLLRILSGVEKPDGGIVSWRSGASFADFNAILTELDPKQTVSDTVAASAHGIAFAPQRKQVEKFLGLLRFPEADLRLKVGSLSGGQKARVALAKCLLSGASTLILDEPTNHLDMSSIQVMERALLHFPGAAVIVSHDRFFIDKVATRLIAFEPDGGVQTINGNWSTWLAQAPAAGS